MKERDRAHARAEMSLSLRECSFFNNGGGGGEISRVARKIFLPPPPKSTTLLLKNEHSLILQEFGPFM